MGICFLSYGQMQGVSYVLLFVFVVILNVSIVNGKSISNEKILVLNETVVNYHVKHIPEGSAMFIQFYAPGCSYCKALAEDWVKLSEADVPNLQLAVVNCEADQSLCRYWELTEVPSLYLLKDKVFYIYKGERDVESMIEFITTDYKRSPSRDLPKALDYRKLKRAQKLKKKQKQDEELFGWVPDMSSPSFMIAAGAVITVFFLAIGYCCAPSVDEEKEDIKGTKKETKKGTEKDNNETEKSTETKGKKNNKEETIKPVKENKKAKSRKKPNKE